MNLIEFLKTYTKINNEFINDCGEFNEKTNLKIKWWQSLYCYF